MTVKEHQARLRWHCRRGMLELDILLGNFLENQFSQLSEVEQKNFERLLDCQDQELFNWLIHREQPDDPDFAVLIERILTNVSPTT